MVGRPAIERAGLAAKSKDEFSHELRVLSPSKATSLDGCASCRSQFLAPCLVPTETSYGSSELLGTVRIDQHRIGAVGQDFADIHAIRCNDRQPSRHVLEEFERRRVRRHSGLQRDIEGCDMADDRLPRNNACYCQTIANA